ncbi:MAG: hypothetical protein RLZZ435_2952 [Cyanobacteriota bacterium]|jgi:hypothetical protein
MVMGSCTTRHKPILASTESEKIEWKRAALLRLKWVAFSTEINILFRGAETRALLLPRVPDYGDRFLTPFSDKLSPYRTADLE